MKEPTTIATTPMRPVLPLLTGTVAELSASQLPATAAVVKLAEDVWRKERDMNVTQRRDYAARVQAALNACFWSLGRARAR